MAHDVIDVVHAGSTSTWRASPADECHATCRLPAVAPTLALDAAILTGDSDFRGCGCLTWRVNILLAEWGHRNLPLPLWAQVSVITDRRPPEAPNLDGAAPCHYTMQSWNQRVRDSRGAHVRERGMQSPSPMNDRLLRCEGGHVAGPGSSRLGPFVDDRCDGGDGDRPCAGRSTRNR